MSYEKDEMLNKSGALLTTAWRLLGRLGFIDTIFNHISIADESSDGALRFSINSDRILPVEIDAESVRILQVRQYAPLEGRDLGVNPDGLVLHSLIHSARLRSGAVIHTHAPYSLAVGCSEQGLLPLTQTAMEFYGELHTIDYGSVFRGHVLTEPLITLARNGGAALLRNHGSLVVADTVEEAFYLTYYLEEACKLQVLALSQGVPLVIPEESIIEYTRKALVEDRSKACINLFQALARTIGK